MENRIARIELASRTPAQMSAFLETVFGWKVSARAPFMTELRKAIVSV